MLSRFVHADALGLYTDLYQLTMAQGYVAAGRHTTRATFDYFFRTAPFGGGYAVFAGLGDLLDLLPRLRFDTDAIDFLRGRGFDADFLAWLGSWRFGGDVFSVREGEIVFPGAPIVRVEASLVDAQLIETLLLNVLNFESLVATKCTRIVEAAGPGRAVLDFGLRRAQGLGGLQASRAAAVGGAVATSNVLAARLWDLPVAGTMAHAWVQSFGDELEAFRTFAARHGAATVFLVDTYDTLRSGVPNAIRVALEMRERGEGTPAGIRLDSGDLAYLAKKARAQLDDAGLYDVKIAASNALDEHLVKSLLDQGAPIEVFGVGTRLVTAWDDPALDGVYKLAEVDGRPTMKRSDNIAKTTLPGRKGVLRLSGADGELRGDAVVLERELGAPVERIHHPLFPDMNTHVAHLATEPLLARVVQAGEVAADVADVQSASALRAARLARLPAEHRRFENPHTYKVGISSGLLALRGEILRGERDLAGP